MKILIGGFIAESNAYVEKPCEIQDFTIITGDAIADRLYITEIAKEENIDLVPCFLASGAGAGRVSYDAFDYILKQFIKGVKQHQHQIDGLFFFFQGASKIIDLEGGSGDHALIREIRKVVGPYMPIAMVMDPHGNLSQEQADNCNIIRTFRHSPHTDRNEAHQIVFKSLIDVLRTRRVIHPVYRKVPILLGGERCVSTDEPLVSINKLLNEIEADPRIMCCSYHIGYLRHDNEKCG
ncbi:MAG: M81 family metallopeptidase, partial [Anaerorhabdus sp.]